MTQTYPFLLHPHAGAWQILWCFVPDVWMMTQAEKTLLVCKH